MAKIFKPFEHKGVVDCTEVLKQRGDRVTHGDLIIVRCEESDFPVNFAELKEAPEGVLAEGEHTQHAHQLFLDTAPMTPAFVAKKKTELRVVDGVANEAEFVLKQVSPTEMYMIVAGGPMLLKHQEHKPFRIPAGRYQIGVQQEYDPFEQMRRAVVD